MDAKGNTIFTTDIVNLPKQTENWNCADSRKYMIYKNAQLEFVDKSHVIIGTTQHNASIAALGEVNHGGAGLTQIGCIEGDVARLQPVADAWKLCTQKQWLLPKARV